MTSGPANKDSHQIPQNKVCFKQFTISKGPCIKESQQYTHKTGTDHPPPFNL